MRTLTLTNTQLDLLVGALCDLANNLDSDIHNGCWDEDEENEKREVSKQARILAAALELPLRRRA